MNERTTLRPQTAPTHTFTPAPTGLLHRKCACGGTPGHDGECAECRSKRLQRAVSEQAQTVPPVVHEVLRSSGQPLDTNARAFMEGRFGHDFSRVRVHTSEKAAESAQAVNALAYTVGRDVVFDTGQYAPGTDAGRRLLAHELTHVVQQENNAGGQATSVSQPSDPHEREAADAAERLTRMPATAPEVPQPADDGSAPATVQRQAADGEPEGDAEEAPPVAANEEEGFEINPEELMVLPRWSMATMPQDSGPETASFATTQTAGGTLQRQGPAAAHCDTPTQMRKVISGTFEGGKTLDDYFPDQVGAGIWGSNNTAGPFDNGTRAGSAVQLVGHLPIPCATSSAPTTLSQTATIVRARANGSRMMEGGRALEGQTFDDIARSRRDQSRAPFRQTWVGAVSMADPISGIPYSTLANYEWEVNLTTSLTGAGGTVSVGWGVTVEATGGRVTRNEVR